MFINISFRENYESRQSMTCSPVSPSILPPNADIDKSPLFLSKFILTNLGRRRNFMLKRRSTSHFAP